MEVITDCRHFLFICTVVTLQMYMSASACNVPSRFWCESKEVATSCGVLEQCNQSKWALHQEAKPVDFAVYYESLSQDSRYFIITMLYPTFATLSAITNLTLIPYGNAKERQDGNHWEFECENGPEECTGNIIATCTIAVVKNESVYLPFLTCLVSSNVPPKESAEQCAIQFPVPLDNIFNCTTSDYGNQLQHEMARKTDALIPQHAYVPWVTLNGVHTAAIQQEAELGLRKLLCDAYTVGSLSCRSQ